MLTMLEERGAIEAPAMAAYLGNGADVRDADIGLLIARAVPVGQAGVEICLDLLQRYPLPSVRREALSRLGFLLQLPKLAAGPWEHITDRFVRLANSDDKDLKASAIIGLGWTGEHSLQEIGWKAIKGALRDSDPGVRAAAVGGVERLHSYGRGGHSDVYLVRELEALMKSGEQPEERKAAAEALRYIGEDAGVLAALLDELIGSDIHDTVASTLGKLFEANPPDVATRKLLLGMLEGSDETVRRLAIKSVTLPGEQAPGTGKALLKQLEKRATDIGGDTSEVMEALETRVVPDADLVGGLSAIIERQPEDAREMTRLQREALQLVALCGEKADAAAPAVGTWLGTEEGEQAREALAKMGSRARQVLRADRRFAGG